jgi:hypothetical protein
LCNELNWNTGYYGIVEKIKKHMAMWERSWKWL